MNLVGIKVKHKVFGSGVIVNQRGNYFAVHFAKKAAWFVYPNVFLNKFMKAEDVEIQAQLLREGGRLTQKRKGRLISS